MYAYRRDEENGSESDLSLSHKVRLCQRILRVFCEGFVELCILIILNLLSTAGRGRREEREGEGGKEGGKKRRREGKREGEKREIRVTLA